MAGICRDTQALVVIKKPKPKVKYIQIANPDQAAVDNAFNYLFDKLLMQEKSKKRK